MSIGFTVPFVVISRGPIASGREVGLIIACFCKGWSWSPMHIPLLTTVLEVITGIANALLVYVLAVATQRLLQAVRVPRTRRPHDLERGSSEGSTGSDLVAVHRRLFLEPAPVYAQSASHRRSGRTTSRSARDFSDAEYSGGVIEKEARRAPPTCKGRLCAAVLYSRKFLRRARGFAQRHTLVSLSVVSVLLLGLPLAFAPSASSSPQASVALDSTTLLVLWTTALTVQETLKHRLIDNGRPTDKATAPWAHAAKVLVVALLNPVLCTSLLFISYTWAKAAHASKGIDEVLDVFLTGNTASSVLGAGSGPREQQTIDSYPNQPPSGHGPSAATAAVTSHFLGAGDLALSLLSSGLLTWGLRLFECRKALLSRSGIAVVTVSVMSAAVAVVTGPALASARALGLRPPLALAFAARSVTLALAQPVIARLGGDAPLNAAAVVCGGVVWQVSVGLWPTSSRPGGGNEDSEEAIVSTSPSPSSSDERSVNPETASLGTVGAPRAPRRDGAAPGSRMLRTAALQHKSRCHDTSVAWGITTGINAAAMGTAHLYEIGSDAAPFAALAMTVYGVATVALVAIDPVAVWLVWLAGGR